MATSSSISYLTTIFLLISLYSLSLPTVQSQTTPVCNAIQITYTYTTGIQLTPNVSDTTRQPYRFESTLKIANNGLDELKNWQVQVDFQHGEFLVSASNAVLADGTVLPANVTNGTVFAGFPSTDLKTALETAGDVTQTTAIIELIGTEFGVKPSDTPLPKKILLVNDGYKCPASPTKGKKTLQLCCVKDPKAKSTKNDTTEFFPRPTGDLTITYDVTQAYGSNYWAEVTISNEDPIARLDNWELSWQWMREEFIFAMKGAYPDRINPSSCIYGPQSNYYKSLDLSTVLTCESKPTIVDLPSSLANDKKLGQVQGCCRNGTILPKTMDPSQSNSSFQIQVYKMPPDLNITSLYPPQNWNIKSSTYTSQNFKCGNPIRVTPSLLPNPDSSIPAPIESIASWQIACNKTQMKPPACCVSFSSYATESAIPCDTCACGCVKSKQSSCNATAQALPIPTYALLLPFENRTDIITAYASIKHLTVPNPLPCGDNCGISINWHLNSDYSDGWTSRISILNWGDAKNYTDWFMSVKMKKAGPGFQAAYSFNGSRLADDDSTIFMRGLDGFNGYLLAETNGSNPDKDPKVPGKVQSLLSFKKKDTPGINVPAGDGYPFKVYFNGDECALPSVLPASKGRTLVVVAFWRLVLSAFLVLLFVNCL